MTKYPAIIDGNRGAYGVVIPDIPGSCNAMGRTVDEALAEAEEVLTEFVELILADGDPIPEPSALEDVVLQPGEMVAYVTLKIPSTAASL